MENPLSEVFGMQVEIPFVPASQRKGAQAIDDSIVVVGQARQKKRKRITKSAPSDASASADAPTTSHRQEEHGLGPQDGVPKEQESFDFSSVPNLLDDNPNLEDKKRQKRQKKQKNGAVDSSIALPRGELISHFKNILQVVHSMAISLLLPKLTVSSKAGINHIHLSRTQRTVCCHVFYHLILSSSQAKPLIGALNPQNPNIIMTSIVQ